MNEVDYKVYVEAFNRRDYGKLETFFADDFVLENVGFAVRGKSAFRKFYAFFHSYCRETVTLHKFFGGEGAFVVNANIRFEGIKDLTAAITEEKGFSGMTPVPMGAIVDVEFLLMYELNSDGLIQHIKGAVYVPANE